jgi:hypothetical protein
LGKRLLRVKKARLSYHFSDIKYSQDYLPGQRIPKIEGGEKRDGEF